MLCWATQASGLSIASLLFRALAMLNPDAWVAQHNIDRYTETGKVDWSYLQGLSDDAVPVLVTLPDDVVACAMAHREPSDNDWLEWNLGRDRANPP